MVRGDGQVSSVPKPATAPSYPRRDIAKQLDLMSLDASPTKPPQQPQQKVSLVATSSAGSDWDAFAAAVETSSRGTSGGDGEAPWTDFQSSEPSQSPLYPPAAFAFILSLARHHYGSLSGRWQAPSDLFRPQCRSLVDFVGVSAGVLRFSLG